MTFQTNPRSFDIAAAVKTEADDFFDMDSDAASFAEVDVEEFMATAPLTDTGVAECFAVKFGANYRCNATADKWSYFSDSHWQEDKTGKVDNDILSTIRHRQTVAAGAMAGDPSARAKALNYLIRCENFPNRKNIKQAAEKIPKLVTTIDQFDADRWLAATQNGTLNLRDVRKTT
jgi:phage/plasmid-associated DNA primase